MLSSFLVGILSLVPPAAAALSRPECTVAGLTNNCEIFSKFGKKPTIPLTDGSSLTNPRAAAGANTSDPEDESDEPRNTADVDPMRPIFEKDLRLQTKITELWGKLESVTKVSSEFKADFNAMIPIPDKLLQWAGRKLIYPPGVRPATTDKITIVWPPSNTEGARKTVSVETLVDFMKSIPSPYKQQMKALLQSRADLKVEVLNSEQNLSGGNPQAPSAKSAADFKAMFDFSKQTLLDEISKGRDPDSLKGGDLSAYNRINTISYGGTDVQNTACAGTQSVAMYLGNTHSFVFCPGAEKNPKDMTVRIMAHEMAHAIGPCQSEVPLVKVNWQALQKLSGANATLPKSIKSDPDLSRLLDTMLRQPLRYPYSVLVTVADIGDASAVARAQKLGYLEVIAPAMTENDNPSTKVLTCLRDQEKIRDVGEKDLATVVSHFAERYQDVTGKKVGPEFNTETKNRLRPFIRCLRTGSNHMLESVPDAWSSKVVGKWQALHPPKNELDRLAVIAFDLPDLCGYASAVSTGKATDASLDLIGSLSKLDQNDEHPSSRRRVNTLLLTEPRVQKALGCEPVPNANCLTKVGTNGDFDPPKASLNKPTSRSRVTQ